MPLLLRKIRKARWYQNEGAHWLPAGEVQADALGDLTTKNNELSVWYVNDNRSNLEQVVTALATAVDHISNLDYALFDHQLVHDINIRVSETRGSTPDETANTTWHRNLIELSANKLSNLASGILARAEKKRVEERRIVELTKQAVTSGRIQRSNLKDGIQARID